MEDASKSSEKEFELLEKNIGKPVRLTVIRSSGEDVYWVLLEEVHPFSALNLTFGNYNDGVFQGTFGEYCPFIGAVCGIKSVETIDGEVIYSNLDLKFDKPFYDPFRDPADNEFINSMRRKKFGEGHDYRMIE